MLRDHAETQEQLGPAVSALGCSAGRHKDLFVAGTAVYHVNTWD